MAIFKPNIQRKMNAIFKITTFIFFTLINTAINAQSSAEEVIYLKNGSVIRGIIVEQVPNQSLKIQTKDKNIFVFNFEEIEKISKRLVAEHRALESLWERLAPELKKVAAGKDSTLDPALLVELVKDYQAHALFEETHFLPKAYAILSRNHNHMEALDLTLHMRHSPYVVGHL